MQSHAPSLSSSCGAPADCRYFDLTSRDRSRHYEKSTSRCTESRWSAAASPSECDADGSTASGLRTSLVDKHDQRHNVIFDLKYTAPNFLYHVSVATDMEDRAKLDYADVIPHIGSLSTTFQIQTLRLRSADEYSFKSSFVVLSFYPRNVVKRGICYQCLTVRLPVRQTRESCLNGSRYLNAVRGAFKKFVDRHS